MAFIAAPAQLFPTDSRDDIAERSRTGVALGYEILPKEVVVFYLCPSWYPSTHPDLASERLHDDE